MSRAGPEKAADASGLVGGGEITSERSRTITNGSVGVWAAALCFGAIGGIFSSQWCKSLTRMSVRRPHFTARSLPVRIAL